MILLSYIITNLFNYYVLQCFCFLKKNLNASSTPPLFGASPRQGKNVKTFRWDHNRPQRQNLFMTFKIWCPCMAINASVRHSERRVYPRYHTVDPMLLPSGKPFKCHEEVSSLQPMFSPKRLDTFPHVMTGESSEGLDAFGFFFNTLLIVQ